MTAPFLLTEDVGPPPYTGCTFVTAVMMARYGGIPLPLGVTTDEHYALVRAAGKSVGNEGATLDDIQRGYLARYGLHAHLFSGTIGDLKALGDVYALVQGVYADLPAHYRRWDLSFTGIHAAGYLVKSAWWQDPLVRQRDIGAGFNGESMTAGVLEHYALGFGGSIHALYLKANEFASSAGPAQPAGGSMYDFSLRSGSIGSVVVKADPAIRYILLKDGTQHPAQNMVKALAIPITLHPPIPGGPVGSDRSSAYLIGDDAAAVLATDVTFTPLPSADSASIAAAIAAHDAKAFVSWKP